MPGGANAALPAVYRSTLTAQARLIFVNVFIAMLFAAHSAFSEAASANGEEQSGNHHAERSEVGAATAKPRAPKDTDHGTGNVIVPLVMYMPETHFGAGGLFVHFFRPSKQESRPSSLALVALVTTRAQAIFELHPELYSGPFHAFGKFEYQRFPDSFWGIGNEAENQAEERYKRNRFRFRGGARYELVKSLYAGPYNDSMYYSATYPSGGLFETQDFVGEAGGVTVGLGLSVVYDTRDNMFATQRGSSLGLTGLVFNEFYGSEYDFSKLILDIRHFIPLGLEHVLAFHLYGESQAGDVPYYHLAMLGGDELLRGYFLGRYRDKNLLALEAAYRFPLYWRFSGVLFAGAGEVARKPDELVNVPVRWAVGTGLRYSLNQEERLNLRLDVGVGPGTVGAYFTAREAF